MLTFLRNIVRINPNDFMYERNRQRNHIHNGAVGARGPEGAMADSQYFGRSANPIQTGG